MGRRQHGEGSLYQRGRRGGGFTLPRGRQPYAGDWVLHWLHNVARPAVGPTTWHRRYRQACEEYIAPYFAKVKLADLCEEDIEGWHRHMAARVSRRGGPLAPVTVASAQRALSAALNAAVARRRLPHNPCSLVPPPKVPRAPREPPTAQEVALILERCR